MVTLDGDGLLERKWLTPNEAAAQARVSVKTVYAWAAKGMVEFRRHEGASRNETRMLVELESLLDCEVATRRSRRGRPRPGTARGPGA